MCPSQRRSCADKLILPHICRSRNSRDSSDGCATTASLSGNSTSRKNNGPLKTFVDTDFAGCLRTRRSTSGGYVCRRQHVLHHWSTTQPTVALSSGEAELAGFCKGASRGLGVQARCLDLGLKLGLTSLTDATAAIGICRRRGAGQGPPPCGGRPLGAGQGPCRRFPI